MNININVNNNETLTEVTVNGEIDVYTAPKLKEELIPLSEKENVDMIVDLSGVSYMDSTGLGVFVGLFKNVRAHEGSFKIIGLSSRLQRLFEITGLADIIDISGKMEGEIR
ncbi:anti-sigma B factor antagonist [Cytobacillus horneckiae]|uniref:Anti-sigma factor antagonist n=1 Tax=Cytobacillus horneckiae TaxID=549687 RepID=A0A2N0ZJT5_9BACI|nr:STAS domain-containing protein [Cytobacillus horneckiae]MBN6888576.1 STAS domain-containing protein [Cytobacillus horneckiae]MCM3180481.1 STAS domain-containing protein [Cytobacillus horneckiae]MEC1158856.1 STAS domain-containing protein [Cytobacillus horneckiae]MED2938723.1 STAS domain-containing protein [Cytobacillus horneckiae]PKG29764.1 anti-sigma factor antagonist [Cytobacillus horneckiae]